MYCDERFCGEVSRVGFAKSAKEMRKVSQRVLADLKLAWRYLARATSPRPSPNGEGYVAEEHGFTEVFSNFY